MTPIEILRAALQRIADDPYLCSEDNAALARRALYEAGAPCPENPAILRSDCIACYVQDKKRGEG